MYYPSVTEAMGPYFNSYMIPPGVLQYAQDRGTEVHHSCAIFATGGFVVPKKEFSPYVESYQQWFNLMVAEVTLVERRFTHGGWGYHGQLDLLALLKDGRRALVDLKTPAAIGKTWRPQIAAYRELCIYAKYQVDCAGSLRLSKKGKMAQMDWYDNSAADFNMFIHHLEAYKYNYPNGRQ